ncbi:MAG: insulinase family protein [Oscillospiraceae bacterium]|nr:insulinase family protein [Oscillospiraceae bacterium]
MRCIIIFERKQIGDGIWFSRITDKRFKVNRISVSFYTEIGGDYSRADYAIVPYILVDSCAKYPDYSQLSLRFSELYGASMSDNTSVMGDVRCSSLAVTSIDDRYALEGEKIERETCQLLLDCLLDPLMEGGAFSAQTTQLMKCELIDSIDSVINDKRNYAAQKGGEAAYKGESWGLSIQGTHEEAERITPESAYGAYTEMLRSGRIEISAVGCSDFTESEQLLTAAFAKLTRSGVCTPYYRPSPLKSQTLCVSEDMPMKQAIMRMYFKAPEMSDRYAGVLLSMILGGMTTSRFFMNIREKQSLCYYCGSFSNRFKRVITVSAGVDAENVERTREAVEAEIRDICENGVSEQELSRAKLEIINDARSVYDGVNSISSWYGSQLMDDEVITPEQYIESIQAVTAERIQAACRMYSPDTFYTLMPEGVQP